MTDDINTTDTRAGFWGSRDRIELIATIVLAVATILTAWSAFQAGKWSGQQSISFSEAGAARTESTRSDTRAGQLAQIDVAMYIDWVVALVDEIDSGAVTLDDASTYEPTKGTISGFLYLRMRPEFLPAMEAWLATDPLVNVNAPSTPFALEEYALADAIEADRLAAVADEKSVEAREANQNGDNYVLTMVLFAAVLFFAGVSAKMYRPRNRMLALSFGALVLATGIVVIATYPILI
jgi:hypothetical protein